ncbi:MAG: anthranilate synthase component I, partial [Alphaproteobacteria bacterium]|nr:anthranilate synthase component I [Alphaproteobacteria bacterium]
MALLPSLSDFAKVYDSARPQVVWTRLVADLETPVSAYMKLVRDRAPSFLLESIEGGESRGRYSIIGLEPDILWRADGNTSSINRSPGEDRDAFVDTGTGTLAALRELLDESAIELPEELPPMAAGVFGYM